MAEEEIGFVRKAVGWAGTVGWILGFFAFLGGEGHISGVHRSDVGERVDVRIGPLGPYAQPLYAYWQVYTVLPAAGWLTYLVVRGRLRKRAPECHDAAL